ncbi:Asp-tRNA(Asn)/Glu-tRNA(Gln) amidotransferase subunit GatC [Candidatus Parcubacteria bacterium]|nr:Asp-tRNA(Asn)/Glu-tRNA(Gln) amidotransferase subunit GatC [Candidatus Parcubacteria bacterium]
MKLEKEEIQKIADLARLDLSEEEKEKYGNQLSDILSYIDQLSEVDVEGVEPTAQVTGLENVYREDEVKVWDDEERQNALNQAPELEDGQVKVRRIL